LLPSDCCHPIVAISRSHRYIASMRAEIQTIVDEIKQSVGLLRRHL